MKGPDKEIGLAREALEQGAEPELSRWGMDEGDVSLIRWMLELNPTERLRFAQGFAHSVGVLKNGRRA